jgi:hypothetical protein
MTQTAMLDSTPRADTRMMNVRLVWHAILGMDAPIIVLKT